MLISPHQLFAPTFQDLGPPTSVSTPPPTPSTPPGESPRAPATSTGSLLLSSSPTSYGPPPAITSTSFKEARLPCLRPSLSDSVAQALLEGPSHDHCRRSPAFFPKKSYTAPPSSSKAQKNTGVKAKGIFDWAMNVAERAAPWRANGSFGKPCPASTVMLADRLVYKKEIPSGAPAAACASSSSGGGAPFFPRRLCGNSSGLWHSDLIRAYGPDGELSSDSLQQLSRQSRRQFPENPLLTTSRSASPKMVKILPSKGPCVHAGGYYKNPEATRGSFFTEDGWFSNRRHRLSSTRTHYFSFITDPPKKNLIKTAAGEKIRRSTAHRKTL